MLVYRIEDDCGVGFYNSPDRPSFENAEYTTWFRHPLPGEDSLLAPLYQDIEDKTHYRYGFFDIIQLRNWIHCDEWLLALHNNRFRLCEYEVADKNVLVGYTQVMFIPSEYVTKYDIKTYFNLQGEKDESRI